MEVFNPLPDDHPLVKGSTRCVLCAHKFIPQDRTTLLVPYSAPGNVQALPVHAGCVALALQGVCEPPPYEGELEDPNLPNEQRALIQRYSDAITMLMIDQLKVDDVGSCSAMINALLAHALIGLRLLNKVGAVSQGGLQRVLQRIKLALDSMPTREYTIQLMKLANGSDDLAEGEWLVSFDPGAPGSRGVVRTTKNEKHAKRFPNHGAAGEFWQQQNGLRADGKPNRPLTAWTVVIEPLEEDIDVANNVDGVRPSEGLS